MAFSYLQKILCQSRTKCCNISNPKFILKELEGIPKLKKVEIIGASKDYFLFKIDCPQTIKILDKSVENINKTCDYAIFYIKENKLCATLCELKSDSPKQKTYFYQLSISKIIVEAIFKIVKLKKDVEFGKIKQILLCTNYPRSRLSKSGIHGNKNVHYNEIDIDNHKLSFNVIVCRNNQQIHINQFT